MERDAMKLTGAQIAYLDRVATGKNCLVRDWRTKEALEQRGLIFHNDATWKYPEPYYRLTDKGREVWASIITSQPEAQK